MVTTDASPPDHARVGRGVAAGHLRGAAELGIVGLLALLWLYIPTAWAADLGPFPDADEYALAARNLAHGHGYALTLLGRTYPPRYPFGFSALLAPWYWLPHATLASGIYGVVFFGALTTILTYLLARAIGGRIAGIAAGVALLLAPQSLHWSHEVMSETATMALIAAVALLVYRLGGRDGGDAPLPAAPLLALGGVLGIALLVRLTNIVLPVAVGGALLADRRVRAQARRAIFLIGPGILLALGALGAYAWGTFGSIAGSGYRYWVPYWYGSLRRTFALSYAVRAPGNTGDPYAPPDMPNLLYYTRSIAGLLPRASLMVLPFSLFLVMVVGYVLLARDPRHAVRIYCLCVALVALSTVGLYAVYFFQSVRFLAPLLPLIAVGIGVAIDAGIRWMCGSSARVNTGRRMRRLVRVMGVGLCALALAGFGVSFASVADESYLVRHYVHHQQSPDGYPLEGQLAGLYQRTVPKGSVIVTDVSLPLLEGTELVRRATIIPLSRRGYLSMPPLDDVPSLAGQADAIARALDDGRPVFTDNFSLDEMAVTASGNTGRAIVDAYARAPVATAGPATLYRLTPRPDTATALLRVQGAGATLAASPDSGIRGVPSRPLVIDWDTGDDRPGEVTVTQNDGGEQLFARGSSGAQAATWLAPRTLYTFRLYAGSTRQTPLRTLTVSLDAP